MPWYMHNNFLQAQNIALTAGRNVTLQSALVDASGGAGGGEIILQGGGQSPSSPPADPPTLALLGDTQLRSSSRGGKGGSVRLTADRVGLFDSSSIDSSGASGGGDVFVGGGFHGKDSSIANAQQTVIGQYIEHYNLERPHKGLDYNRPIEPGGAVSPPGSSIWT